MEKEIAQALGEDASDEQTEVLTVASAAYVDERIKAVVKVFDSLPSAFAVPMALSNDGIVQPSFADELRYLKALTEEGPSK